MKILSKLAIVGALMVASVTTASAATFTEQFPDPMINWTTGFMGTESNLANYYATPGDRGNNPYGIWIGATEVAFNSAFGQSIQSISLFASTFVSNISIQFFDSANVVISTTTVNADGSYQSLQQFSAMSTTGIGGFRFLGSGVVGNTNIDNITVVTADIAPVPLPAGLPLMLGAFGGLMVLRRKSAA